MKGIAEQDIRPLKGPAELWDWWIFLLWGAAIVFAIAFIVACLWLWKRRKKTSVDSVSDTELSRSPHEVALEALSRLANSDYLQRGEVKRFYIELSEIFRRYLGAHYEIDTLDLTTWEISQNFKKINISVSLTQSIMDILEECDLVKFAKYRPPAEIPMKSLEKVRELVNALRLSLDVAFDTSSAISG